jgi:Xaa-Pro aminopeptidase
MSVVTLHGVVKRGALTWDRELLPEAVYKRRIAALQGRMVETGEDAWLMFGDVQNHGPVVWATNFMPRVRSALAYVPRSGAPVLFANISTRDIPAAKTITWVDDIQAFQRLPKSLGEFIAEKHPGGARLGLCGIEQSMPIADWRNIEQALQRCQMTNRDSELDRLRARKDANEIEAIRRAAKLTGGALDKAKDEIRAGRSMRSIIAQIDASVRRQGAEDARFLVASGGDAGASLRPVDDREIAARDCVLIYVAVQNQRYWAEAARTYVLRAPDPVTVALHARAERALDAMTSAARIGASAGEIAANGTEALGDAAASAKGYGLGNGIGLDVCEGPIIGVGGTARLVLDSTLALRVLAHAGGCGVALARTVHVTETGASILTPAPTDLVQVGPRN